MFSSQSNSINHLNKNIDISPSRDRWIIMYSKMVGSARVKCSFLFDLFTIPIQSTYLYFQSVVWPMAMDPIDILY